MDKEKESNKKIIKEIFSNVIIAIAVMLYFMLINFSYMRMDQNEITNGIKIASLIVLFLSIMIFEIAYHKDSGKIALNGIEVLVLAIHTLTIHHIVNKYKVSFEEYILCSSYTFAIYYVLKSILIYTREKRNYLKSLSDIHEIVTQEPIKKEAKKREKEENT